MTENIGNFNLSQIISHILAESGKKKGVKIVDKAQEISISQPTWSRIQSGYSRMSIEDIYHLCKLCEFDTVEIIKEAVETAERIENRNLAQLTIRQTEEIINRTTIKYLISISRNPDK